MQMAKKLSRIIFLSTRQRLLDNWVADLVPYALGIRYVVMGRTKKNQISQQTSNWTSNASS